MRRSALALAAVLVGVLALATPSALAQAGESAFSGTLFVTDLDPGGVLGIEGGTAYGGSLAGQLTPWIGLEGGLLRSSDLDFEEVKATTSMREARFGGLFFFSRPHDRVLPYLALGIGYLDFSRPVKLDKKTLKHERDKAGRSDLFYTEDAARYDNGATLTWGGGVHVFLSQRVALRFDLRWVTSFSGSFNNFEPMLGLSIWSGQGS